MNSQSSPAERRTQVLNVGAKQPAYLGVRKGLLGQSNQLLPSANTHCEAVCLCLLHHVLMPRSLKVQQASHLSDRLPHGALPICQNLHSKCLRATVRIPLKRNRFGRSRSPIGGKRATQCLSVQQKAVKTRLIKQHARILYQIISAVHAEVRWQWTTSQLTIQVCKACQQ